MSRRYAQSERLFQRQKNQLRHLNVAGYWQPRQQYAHLSDRYLSQCCRPTSAAIQLHLHPKLLKLADELHRHAFVNPELSQLNHVYQDHS